MSTKLRILLWILGIITFFSIIELARYVASLMPPSRGISGSWALFLPFLAVLMLIGSVLAFSFTGLVREVLFYLEDRRSKTERETPT